MIRESRTALNWKHLITASALLIALALPCVASADDARGRALYDLCQQCHGPDGAGMEFALAPAIAGLDQWYIEAQLKHFRSGARGTNPDDVGGMRMHPMAQWLRRDEDITAVASYVSSLPKQTPTPLIAGGNAETGGALYATCAACHGKQGEGDQTKNSPPLRNMSDWYLVSALEKYKAGVRGSNPANTNAVLMRGMSNILSDDQAIKDVVAYINTLSD
jgi:cytochrome c oxidase subunit 2